MTERQQFATIMENEAAPTGGRLASPEVIGGKSNRHSGEKGAPQAPFFHAFFRVVAGGETCGEPPRRFLRRGGGVGCCGGGDVASGRALRGRFGRKGAVGAFFSCFFLGVGGRGLPRGRAVVTGFAAGAGRSVEGVRAGGGWSRGVRAPYFVVWGTGPPLFRGGRLFFGGDTGEAVQGECAGGGRRKKGRSVRQNCRTLRIGAHLFRGESVGISALFAGPCVTTISILQIFSRCCGSEKICCRKRFVVRVPSIRGFK